MALLMLFWDFMLLITVLYFHMMIEKVVASGLAVLSWFALYKFFYRQDFSPGLPGSGPFKWAATFKLSHHSEIVRYVTWQDPYLMTKEQRTKALRRHREAESSSSKWSSKVMRLFTMYSDMQMGFMKGRSKGFKLVTMMAQKYKFSQEPRFEK